MGVELSLDQGRNRDVRPVDVKEIQDDGLGILQLQELAAVWTLHRFYPENSVHFGCIGIDGDKGNIDDAADRNRVNRQHSSARDVLPFDSINQGQVHIVNIALFHTGRQVRVRVRVEVPRQLACQTRTGWL